MCAADGATLTRHLVAEERQRLEQLLGVDRSAFAELQSGLIILGQYWPAPLPSSPAEHQTVQKGADLAPTRTGRLGGDGHL